MILHKRRRAQAGFNLMEVLIAMALLGAVLLSIVTLFYMGQNNIYSGKQLTRATSAALHASEDLGALSGPDLFKNFKVIGTTTLTKNTVAGVAYDKSIVRTTDQAGDTTYEWATTETPPGPGFLTQWKSLLTADRIGKGRLTLVMLPQLQTDPNDVTTARLIQMRIIVEWQEGPRARSAIIDTTKMNRL